MKQLELFIHDHEPIYIVNFLEIFVDFNYNHNLIITSKKTLFPYKINDKSPKNYIYLYLLIKPIKTILIIGFLTFAFLSSNYIEKDKNRNKKNFECKFL